MKQTLFIPLAVLLLAPPAALHAADAPKTVGEVSTSPLVLTEGGTSERPFVFDGKPNQPNPLKIVLALLLAPPAAPHAVD